ncbi:DUF881 domain-containing protein [Nocardioides sp. Bht2]|uniref:DUF881 domain-containing protein n=1 Tax=Nocardioides sp. Bht2 TaxID=3392297 RepID=UPI0039B478B6
MTARDHGHRRKMRKWRIATPLVFGCAGMLFWSSANSSDGTDLRPGRNDDLASLVRSESKQYQALEDRAAALNRDVDRLTGQVQDRSVRTERRKAAVLAGPAGFGHVEGGGLRVVLSDSPAEVRESSDENINLLIVHQQDIQAVVNAMWRAGAEAITVQGQRLVSTTGIKCAGNSVELQGIPYPQPFVIEAVGDPTALQAGVDADPYLTYYRSQSVDPAIAIGWEMNQSSDVVAPAYNGLRTLQYATALDPEDS